MSAFGSAFGQPAFGASSGFGAPAAFGQSSQSAFGAAPSFGADPSGGLFGASAPQQPQQQQSAFGAFGQSAPFGSSSVFGSAAQSAPAFGASGAFGASAFGGQSAPAFGAASGFGASSQSAFGSTGGAFGGAGGSLFGSGRPPTGGAFGASGSAFGQTQSAWGASSNAFGASSAFGAPSAAAGGGLFGNTGGGSLFGNQGSAFGGSTNQNRGTSGANWQLTVEYDGNPGVSSKYQAISMMQQFREKSLEELRLEDYAIGNKGGTGSGGAGGSLFGQSAPSTGLFGSSAGGAFGASSSGFGGSAFGAQQSQGGLFGASSGAGLFGGTSGFGNTAGFGQSSAAGFGSGGGFGAQPTGGGLFGQSGASAGFGAQSGSGFGGGGTGGFGSSGFGSGAAGFGSSGGAFGSGGGFGGGGGFAASGAGFGQSSGGFGSGLGGPGFGASGQSGGTGLFGQSSGGNAFGAPQPQQGLFGAPQSGGGLFGGGGNAAGSGFGAAGGAQSGSNIFGGGGQGNLFGAASSSAGTAPSLFGANTGGQKPLFGAPSSGGFGFGAAASGGSRFAGSGNAFGQSTANTGFGFAGGFGAQPNQQQNPQPLFCGGQVALGGQPQGNHPSILNTAAAVTQHNGGTVAPSGANYGTVLHNLQKLQSELSQQKRLLEEHAKRNATNSQQPGSLSVVVLPTPPLVRLSNNRVSASGSLGAARSAHRTRMRSVVGRIGGATNKISGTPLKTPGTIVKVEESIATPASAESSGKRMPFFSPEQFTGMKRRPLRSADIMTPHKSTPIPLPIPGMEPSVNGVVANRPMSEERQSAGKPRIWRANGLTKQASLRSRSRSGVSGGKPDNTPPVDRRPDLQVTVTSSPKSRKGTAKQDTTSNHGSGIRSSAAKFMWSSPRPSAWSLKTPVDSIDQYDPDKYLPFLTKEGFYTVPSLSELASQTMKELQNVEGFTVGREGYGEVKWIEPVDVRGLDLDSVIDIQRGEVAVYPDKDASQLDAAAVVTLFGMYKKDKRTGTPTTDKDLAGRYARKLQAFCEQNELRFISYVPENGCWQFEAQGFAEE